MKITKITLSLLCFNFLTSARISSIGKRSNSNSSKLNEGDSTRFSGDRDREKDSNEFSRFDIKRDETRIRRNEDDIAKEMLDFPNPGHSL